MDREPEHATPRTDGLADALPPTRFADDGVEFDRASQCFGFLRGVPILYELDDTALWELARCAEEREFEPGARIVAQGGSDDDAEHDRRFYIIRSGSADVLRRDRSGHERVVARLTLGSYFGELGLLTNQARNATVRVHGDMPLRAYAFDALTFHRKIAEHVLVFRVLKERQERTSTTPDATVSSPSATAGRGRLRIKELDLLKRLPEADLEFILQSAEHRWYPAHTSIIRQGDAGDRFFILLEGGVRVVRDGEAVADLEPGDFFGETALLLDTPRTASIEATEHVLTWSITRSAFQRLVGGYLLSNPRTQAEIVRRMQSVLPEGDEQSPTPTTD